MQDSKGILIPIGGGDNYELFMEILNTSPHKKASICYITMAISDEAESREKHKMLKKEAGKNHEVSLIHCAKRADADSEKNLAKVKECDILFISGGNQLHLSSLLGGTEMLSLIKERYRHEADFIVAGNSAGAAAMSSTMIVSGSSQDALVKGDLRLTNGLGFITDMFIDTHITDRGRFGRMIQALAYNPGILGLGLGQDTAAIIKGNNLHVIGAGLAVIADGKNITYSDITEISDGDPITVEGIKMHVLANGKTFLLDERKLKL